MTCAYLFPLFLELSMNQQFRKDEKAGTMPLQPSLIADAGNPRENRRVG